MVSQGHHGGRTPVTAVALPGPVVAITGPTASGKSAVADAVAEALDSAVVSVDAMQVYRSMDIGTAKVPVDQRRVPLLMVDVADPSEEYSVVEFQRQGRAVIDGLLAQDRVPVLCGGTGLYLDALIDEMEFAPGHMGSPHRKEFEDYLERHGAQALWELLDGRDPESARVIHPHNSRRVVRALEMAAEGESYAARKERLRKRPAHYDARIWTIVRNPEVLPERIAERVDAMFSQGLVAEVESLMAQGLGEALTARQAIGYKEVIDYLEGRRTLAEARDAIVAATRRYAKRQRSWIRRDGRARPLDLDALSVDEAVARILEDLDQGTPVV